MAGSVTRYLVWCTFLASLTLCSSEDTKVEYSAKASISTLKLVQMVFRHGDRSPISIFPNDENKEDKWPRGLGQLSDEGMEQAHEMGTFLRNRYDGFIGKDYNLKELYVRSSDVDRSVLTAQNMLAGLYPQLPRVASSGQQWIPTHVPVHTVPKENDYMVHLGSNCPRYQELSDAHYKAKDSQNRRAALQDLVDLAWNNSGYQESSKMDKWQAAGKVRDTLVCEGQHNLTQASWVTDDWLEQMRTKYYDIDYSLKFRPVDIAKLRGGVLLQEMVKNMEKVKNNKEKRKMFVYSAHDTTVAALLVALRMFNKVAVPYTSNVIVEMHTSDTNNYTVQVFFRNSSQDLYQLAIPDCGNDCPCTKFQALTANVRSTGDIESDCKSFSIGGIKVPLLFGLDRAMTIIILSVSVGVLILITLICVIRCVRDCCRKRRLRNRRKTRNLSSIMPETVKLVSSGVSDSDEEFR